MIYDKDGNPIEEEPQPHRFGQFYIPDDARLGRCDIDAQGDGQGRYKGWKYLPIPKAKAEKE